MDDIPRNIFKEPCPTPPQYHFPPPNTMVRGGVVVRWGSILPKSALFFAGEQFPILPALAAARPHPFRASRSAITLRAPQEPISRHQLSSASRAAIISCVGPASRYC